MPCPAFAGNFVPWEKCRNCGERFAVENLRSVEPLKFPAMDDWLRRGAEAIGSSEDISGQDADALLQSLYGLATKLAVRAV